MFVSTHKIYGMSKLTNVERFFKFFIPLFMYFSDPSTTLFFINPKAYNDIKNNGFN